VAVNSRADLSDERRHLAGTGVAVSPWRAEQVVELAGHTVEWAEPADYILSRRETLYQGREPKAPFNEYGRMPLSPSLRIGSRVELVRRALRLDYYNVLRIGDEQLFVTFNRSVALVTPEGTRPVTGLVRPFRVLRGGCAVAGDGSVLFGEYVIMRDPGPLRIYRLEPGSGRAEIVHLFPAKFARHIHAICVDPFDESIWCLTGDHMEQAKVLRSADGLEPFTTIGTGNESWRAVSIQFRSDAVYYASDSQVRQNWIYRIDRTSGERTEVAPVDGPVYYSHRVGDDLFFAVTAERGARRQGSRASLWHLDRDDRCGLIASFAKDRWWVDHFLPGTLSFPRGSGEGDSFFFSGVALAEAHRATFRCSPRTVQP
jgi:hypothetical protein